MLASAHVAAAVWGIRRFAVGMTGPVMFLSDAAWSPPLPHWFLAAAFSAGVAATGAYLARWDPGAPWGDRRAGAGAAVQDPGPVVPEALSPAERRRPGPPDELRREAATRPRPAPRRGRGPGA